MNKQAKRSYGCPVEVTIEAIGGKWKAVILWWLRQDVKGFSELKYLIPGISSKVLTQQLRELEASDLVQRQVYQSVPPRVEYALTAAGKELRPLVELMCSWGMARLPRFKAGWLELSGLSVFLVSEAPALIRFVQTELEIRQAQVKQMSVSQASQQVELSGEPQIWLLDMALPPALELARLLRASRRSVVGLTELADPTERQLALRAGCQVHLSKPLDAAELTASLASLTRILN